MTKRALSSILVWHQPTLSLKFIFLILLQRLGTKGLSRKDRDHLVSRALSICWFRQLCSWSRPCTVVFEHNLSEFLLVDFWTRRDRSSGFCHSHVPVSRNVSIFRLMSAVKQEINSDRSNSPGCLWRTGYYCGSIRGSGLWNGDCNNVDGTSFKGLALFYGRSQQEWAGRAPTLINKRGGRLPSTAHYDRSPIENQSDRPMRATQRILDHSDFPPKTKIFG